MKTYLRLINSIILSLMITFTGCTGRELNNSKSSNTFEFYESTENLKSSGDSIDQGPTYELYFTLENTADCISIGVETVYLQKKFPVMSVPKKSYFIVEKLLEVPGITARKGPIYVPAGKNFDSNWEVHSPVKICGNKNDPVSSLDRSVFRIRFTTFEKVTLFCTVTVYSPVKVLFSTDPEKLKQQSVPVKENQKP